METEMNADMMLEEYRRYLIYNEKVSRQSVSMYGMLVNFWIFCRPVGERKTK